MTAAEALRKNIDFIDDNTIHGSTDDIERAMREYAKQALEDYRIEVMKQTMFDENMVISLHIKSVENIDLYKFIK